MIAEVPKIAKEV